MKLTVTIDLGELIYIAWPGAIFRCDYPRLLKYIEQAFVEQAKAEDKPPALPEASPKKRRKAASGSKVEAAARFLADNPGIALRKAAREFGCAYGTMQRARRRLPRRMNVASVESAGEAVTP